MTKEELQKYIEKGESATLEFQTNIIPGQLLKKIINSMVNTKGGMIILGVGEDGETYNIDIKVAAFKILKDNTICFRGVNRRSDIYFKYVKIEKSLINGNVILIINIKKKKIGKLKNTDGNIYKRINDTTALITQEFNKLKSIEETKVIKSTKVPEYPMNPGDEIVVYEALQIYPHKNNVAIKYKFDSDGISVLAPYQDEPNTIRLEPNDEESKYHLKYCASNKIDKSCKKQLYIIAEELIIKKWPYIVKTIISIILIILSFIPIFKSFFKEPEWISIQLFDLITLPLPLITILSFILMSNRVDKVLKRLSFIKIESFSKYQEKHIGDEIEIHKDNY